MKIPINGMLAITLSISSVILVAGLEMKQLQAYGLAIAGSILAVLVTPGNLVGVPVGIWALVVLSQRQVRQAFGKGHTVAHFEAARPANGGKAWKVAAVIMAAVMLLIAIPVGAGPGRKPHWSRGESTSGRRHSWCEAL
jgi:hypothetical protein